MIAADKDDLGSQRAKEILEHGLDYESPRKVLARALLSGLDIKDSDE